MIRRLTLLFLILSLLTAPKAMASISVLGELTRYYVVRPAGTYEGTIQIMNRGNKPQDVAIEKKDYLFYKDGRNKFDPPPSHARSNGEWISVSPSKATIQPGEMLNVNFRIQVPQKEDLKGTYWSVLMVAPNEPISPEMLLRSEDKKITMSLKVVVQHAIQIITDLGETGSTKIKFAEKKLTESQGKRIAEVCIENTGERWFTPQLVAELFNDQGKSIGKFQGTRLRLLPGCSGKFTVDFGELPKGKYKALLIADDLKGKVFGTKWNFSVE